MPTLHLIDEVEDGELLLTRGVEPGGDESTRDDQRMPRRHWESIADGEGQRVRGDVRARGQLQERGCPTHRRESRCHERRPASPLSCGARDRNERQLLAIAATGATLVAHGLRKPTVPWWKTGVPKPVPKDVT